jgi:hypothetical protein
MNVLLVVLLRIENKKNQVLYQLEPKKFVETERVWIYWPDDIVTISLSVYESLHTLTQHTFYTPSTYNKKYKIYVCSSLYTAYLSN